MKWEEITNEMWSKAMTAETIEEVERIIRIANIKIKRLFAENKNSSTMNEGAGFNN